MRLKEIFACYVEGSLLFEGDISELRASFIKNRFREKKLNESKWVYKRGNSVGMTSDYDSEVLEIVVMLELRGDVLHVRVGNWGFPFEPYLMKNRFRRSLDRMISEITDSGFLTTDDIELANLDEIIKKNKKESKWTLIFVVLGSASAVIINKVFDIL